MNGLKNSKNRKGKRFLLGVLFLGYLAALIYFLFFSEHYGRVESEEYHYNLTVFKEIQRYIQYREQLGWEYFFVNIFGNVLAFVPFGFFLPLFSEKNRSFIYVTVYTFEASLVIELLQLVFRVGTFDVDDLLMNTIGGAIGCILFFMFRGKHKNVL